MLKSILYKSLEDTLKITPTCFGSQRIHHQGVLTCNLTEITCSGSQIFIMCVVGVWRHYSEPVVCVCVYVCVCARYDRLEASRNAHTRAGARTHKHTHTTGSVLCRQTPIHAYDKYL
jgi:hypothetical protein